MIGPYCFSLFQEIYKQGGNLVLFNSAPLGCTPVMEAIKLGGNGEYMEESTMLARLHIRAFSKVLQKLESKLKGFKYSISNFYTLLEERMDNPSKYGMLPSSSYYMPVPVAQSHLCSNSPFVFNAAKISKKGRQPVVVGVPTGVFLAVEGREQ